jgi:N6-L-threonylcarbamoyladenine synthase
MRAVEKFQPKSVILAGGVAANRQLRESLSSAIANYKLPITLHAPDFAYTSDNAAMIAATGYFKALRGEFADPLKLEAEPNLQL